MNVLDRKRKTLLYFTTVRLGVGGSRVVKTLCYKPEGRGFENR
jgi:hypothetical protein